MFMWLNEYRWLFIISTITLLGFAYYKTWKDRKKGGKVGLWLLNATTVLSLGMIVYSLLKA